MYSDPDTSFVPRRLAKFVRESSGRSHNCVARAWYGGEIVVQREGTGDRVVVPLQEYVFAHDRVWWGARELERAAPPSRYYVLHKPKGIVSTASDPGGKPDLAPWLEEPGVFPVGRLDRDTTGLLLLTDDGDLAYMLLKPLFHVDKEYWLRLRGQVERGDTRLEALRHGLDLGDGRHDARALDVRVCAGGATWTGARMVLDEGRYRQIRRMCRAAKFYLDHLHRVRVGPVRLGAIGPGQVRALTEGEIEALWTACGGRDLARTRAIEALRRGAQRAHEAGQPRARVERWLEAWDGSE